MRYRDLPELPSRPHHFFSLDSLEVSVKLPARELPVRIHCKTAGSGPPLLLIHGLMTSGYSFRYVIPALAKRYRVIVPDLPGAGRSDAPPDLSMSPRSVAQVIRLLISTLGIEPPYLVGNSLGGFQCLWVAVLFPSQIRKLVVMHAPGFPQLGLSLLQFVLGVPGGRVWLRWAMCRDPEGFAASNIHYYDRSVMSREEAREYGSIFRSRARTDVFMRILREGLGGSTMRELEALVRQFGDAQHALPPVRLFWARADRFVPPSFGLRYQALLPGTELIWFDRASHLLQVDDPERTAEEILRF